MMAELAKERAAAEAERTNSAWAVKFVEQYKKEHFRDVEAFRSRIQVALNLQEEKLRKMSIEIDEELYPHLCQSVAERRWLISHGLRLAAIGTLEHPKVTGAFGKVVECAVAHGKTLAISKLAEDKHLSIAPADVPGFNVDAPAELMAAMLALKNLDLPHIGMLERDQDMPIDVIMAGLTLPRHQKEGAEQQPDYYLKPSVAQLKVPIFAQPRSILEPFRVEKEVALETVLTDHATRCAKKKGQTGRVVLCGIGAAHLPRSDGVPVMVATVSQDDAALLHRLRESKEAALAESSSPLRRTYSI